MITYQGRGYNNNIGANPNSFILNNTTQLQNNNIPIGYNGYNQNPPQMNYPPYNNGGYYNQNQQQMNNGGYYNQNIGYGYYNPYLIQKQQEQLRAQEDEARRNQSDIWKKLSRNANKYNDIIDSDDMDNHLKRYDYESEDTNSKDYYLEQKQLEIDNIVDNGINVELLPSSRVEAINNEIARVQQIIPPDISAHDYMIKFGDLYYEMWKDKLKRNSVNRTDKMYDTTSYQELARLHNSPDSFFTRVFGNNNTSLNMDDMTVSMPKGLSEDEEYSKRRQQFIDSIFRKDNPYG